MEEVMKRNHMNSFQFTQERDWRDQEKNRKKRFVARRTDAQKDWDEMVQFLSELKVPKEPAWNEKAEDVEKFVVSVLSSKDDPEENARLKDYGDWIKRNGEDFEKVKASLIQKGVITKAQLKMEVKANMFDQIVQLMYLPPVRDPTTGEYGLSSFKGLLAAETVKSKPKEIVVPKDWVRLNFHPRYVREVQRRGRVYHDVPAGKRKGSFQEEVPNKKPRLEEKVDSNLPKVRFKKISEAKRTCIGYGLASALHYAKDFGASSSIHKCAERLSFDPLWYETVQTRMNRASKKFVFFREYGREFRWSLASPKDLYVGLILRTDGGMDHCVSIYDKYIFDDEEDTVLVLNKASLDRCSGEGGFIEMVRVLHYKPKKIELPMKT